MAILPNFPGESKNSPISPTITIAKNQFEIRLVLAPRSTLILIKINKKKSVEGFNGRNLI